jgi:hypothetical protein
MPSSFLLYLSTSASKLSVSVAMISRTANQKMIVETRDENIVIELIPFFFKSSIRGFVSKQIAPQKGKFLCTVLFFAF